MTRGADQGCDVGADGDAFAGAHGDQHEDGHHDHGQLRHQQDGQARATTPVGCSSNTLRKTYIKILRSCKIHVKSDENHANTLQKGTLWRDFQRFSCFSAYLPRPVGRESSLFSHHRDRVAAIITPSMGVARRLAERHLEIPKSL